MSVRTKEFHTRKVGQNDELVQIGDKLIDNMTLDEFKQLITTPTLGMDGYNVTLVFKSTTDGHMYRLPGEAMKVRVFQESPTVPLHGAMPAALSASMVSAPTGGEVPAQAHATLLLVGSA